MVRGIYTAVTGALVAQYNVDTLANNLANVNTGGFKRTLLQVEANEAFELSRYQTDPGKRAAVDPIGALGFGSRVLDTPVQFEQGPMQLTGNTLDFGLNGGGFFTIQTQHGLRYTRNGGFLRNQQGLLATANGDLVMGTRGAIAVPVGEIEVGRDGTISLRGQPLDRLRITNFTNLRNLRKEGDNLFVDLGAGAAPMPNSSVMQRYLEKSNADVVRSMVDMITAQRWFDANEKVIQTQDDLTARAIAEVGRTQRG